MIIIVWSIAKNHRNFFWHTIFQMTYTMDNILLFTCIMIMISKSTISFIFSTFIFILFFTNISDFCISYGSFCSFLNNFTVFFLKLIGVIACFLYTRCLLSMSLNYNIGDRKTWRKMFAYFHCRWLLRIIFISIHIFYQRFKICINSSVSSNFWYWLNPLIKLFPNLFQFLYDLMLMLQHIESIYYHFYWWDLLLPSPKIINSMSWFFMNALHTLHQCLQKK